MCLIQSIFLTAPLIVGTVGVFLIHFNYFKLEGS